MEFLGKSMFQTLVFPVDLPTGKVRRRAKVRREGNEGKRGHFEENFEDFRF